MDNSNHINRREAIKRAGLLLGGVAFAPNILGVLQGCTAKPGVDWEPVLFTDEQARLITSISDIILPKDDYPSASEAGVPAFIESMVNDVYTDEQRDNFLKKLDDFREEARLELETEFYEESNERQYQFAYNKNENSLNVNPGDGTPFFIQLKELVLLGYFTSEVGATEVLQYLPVPGKYEGCIPLEEVGKTWAT
jgi:hypothetical protein